MTHRPHPNLQRLARLAGQVRSAQFARLAASTAARDANLSLLAGLDRASTGDADPALALAALRHQRWAEQRRRALLAEIAHQNLSLAQDRADATKALARCLALDRLLKGQF